MSIFAEKAFEIISTQKVIDANQKWFSTTQEAIRNRFIPIPNPVELIRMRSIFKMNEDLLRKSEVLFEEFEQMFDPEYSDTNS